MAKTKNTRSDKQKSALRRLPAVEKLLKTDHAAPLIERHSRPFLVSALRKALDAMRGKMRESPDKWEDANDADIEAGVFDLSGQFLRPDLRRVINATGVIVHTNLGRAPLADEAISAMNDAARGYSNLEYDLEAGARGSRQSLIDTKICELVGSEAALVINNNAGAVLLALMALAKGKEAIVSRGELVEIGGSFRIPDVMAASGAVMVEVGTTNKTHFKDYKNAVNNRTAILLKVHRSNFFIGGFTLEVSVEELSKLAREKNLALMFDLGSGALVDTDRFGLRHEQTPGEALKQGADLVTFSGDKLLGGPQAGIIAGKKEFLMRLKSHPAHRALRPDKLTLAALEATLRLYIQGREDKIPVIAMLAARPDDLKKRADAIKKRLDIVFKRRECAHISADVVESASQVGGGALADAEIPSWAIAISSTELSPERIIERLRDGETPVIARIERDNVLLDMRSLYGTDEGELKELILAALA